jgi:alkylation response protein AidB-like acyl-CoA dehydrogenase
MFDSAGRSSLDIGAALNELGWQEVVADDCRASGLLFSEHGRALANSRILDTVVIAELSAILPPTEHVRAVAYPTPTPAAGLTSTAEKIDGVVLTSLDGVDELIVPIQADDGVAIVLIPTSNMDAHPLGSIDTDLRWHRVQGAHVSNPIAAGAQWVRAEAAGRRALVAEILGAATAALTLAVEHTSSRNQFGAPIASFQAVRHRLAESHVALASCEGVLDAAWTSEDPTSAMVAKASAGRTQAVVARAVLQVCGAVGLSLEHPLHRYVERAAVLDALLTPHLILIEELGKSILAGDEIHRLSEISYV